MALRTTTATTAIFALAPRRKQRGKASLFSNATFAGWRITAVVAAVCLLAASAVRAASTNIDLTDLPIEKLMDIKVTILRGHDTLSKTPAAVSVVAQAD